MSRQWIDFLASKGIHYAASGSVDTDAFDDPRYERETALTRNAIYALQDIGTISVEGEDACSFLHAQLTQDLQQLPASRWTRAAWCNAKGRVLALFHVVPQPGGFLLLLPRVLLEPMLKRLRMFVLRSQVTLTDVTDSHVIAGLSGPEASDMLRAINCSVPATGALTCTPPLTVLALGGEPQRFILISPDEVMMDAWQRLTDTATPCGAHAWNLLDILNGEPSVVPETQERFVPQMLNLHWLSGVSFRKGCYPGQEVVARMQYLGRLKQRLYLAEIDQAATPAAGAPVYADGSNQAAGTVVNASPHPHGGQVLLAVLRIDAAETAVLRLEPSQGAPLHLLELPYSIDTPLTGERSPA